MKMANHQEVKLFGVWFSPFSRRVKIALKMKGIEYEYIGEDLSNKSPSLLKYNPVHKKIPVLLHNGKPIAESIVILEYIDETWKSGTPILPKDPQERAMARLQAKYADDLVMLLWRAGRSTGEEQEHAIKEINEILKTLESALKDKKFFGGEDIGLVDIVANFVAFWFVVVQEVRGMELLTKDKFPNICGWIDEYLKCTVIKENMPPRDELLSFIERTSKPADD